GPGYVLRVAERSSPGSTFIVNVVSSGGISPHPAAQPAGRGPLHPANVDPPGANNHIPGILITPRSLRNATEPQGALRGSAAPRELQFSALSPYPSSAKSANSA